MEITTENWTFYIDDTLIPRSIMEQVWKLTVPIELYNLQQEKGRLEEVTPPSDEYLLNWSRENCPDSLNMRENMRRLDEVNTLIDQYQP